MKKEASGKKAKGEEATGEGSLNGRRKQREKKAKGEEGKGRRKQREKKAKGEEATSTTKASAAHQLASELCCVPDQRVKRKKQKLKIHPCSLDRISWLGFGLQPPCVLTEGPACVKNNVIVHKNWCELLTRGAPATAQTPTYTRLRSERASCLVCAHGPCRCTRSLVPSALVCPCVCVCV